MWTKVKLYELYGRDFPVITSVVTSITDKTHVTLAVHTIYMSGKKCRQTSNISHTLVHNEMLITQIELEHRLSVLLQLHLYFRLNTWLQWIGQRQLQGETKSISFLKFGATYIRGFNVSHWNPGTDGFPQERPIMWGLTFTLSLSRTIYWTNGRAVGESMYHVARVGSSIYFKRTLHPSLRLVLT